MRVLLIATLLHMIPGELPGVIDWSHLLPCSQCSSLKLANNEHKVVKIWKLHNHESIVDCHSLTYHTWRASKSHLLALDTIQKNCQHHCSHLTSLNLANNEPKVVKIWKLHYHESIVDCHSHTYHTWRASKTDLLALDAIQKNCQHALYRLSTTKTE